MLTCIDCCIPVTEENGVRDTCKSRGYRAMCRHCQKIRHRAAHGSATRANVRNPNSTRNVLQGYYRIKVGNAWLQEHRVVMAEILGRPLLSGENVHHINGDKLDNRPENLELWITKQPKGQRAEDLIAWATEILTTHGYEVSKCA